MTVAAISAINASAYAAGAVPWEEMLKEVRATMRIVRLSDAEKAMVADLEAKGVERCNPDDDQRADGFCAIALKIMGK